MDSVDAPPNASIRGSELTSIMDVLDRMLGRYSDRVHELPEEQKFATGAMPMAPTQAPFVLRISASGGYSF